MFYFYVYHTYQIGNKIELVKILFVYIMEFFLFKLENKCQYNIIIVYLSFTKTTHSKSHLFSIKFCIIGGAKTVYVFQ